jgi:hypothetical protein
MSLRVSRRNAAEPPTVAEDDASEDAPSASGWKSEIDAVTTGALPALRTPARGMHLRMWLISWLSGAGTHQALVAELAVPLKTMQSQIAQAERLKNAQAGNIHALFECDKKQVDDEYKVSARCSRAGRCDASAWHPQHTISPRRRCMPSGTAGVLPEPPD